MKRLDPPTKDMCTQGYLDTQEAKTVTMSRQDDSNRGDMAGAQDQN